jgi:putative chitinase
VSFSDSFFFNRMRAGLLGPTLSAAEVKGCAAILEACRGMPVSWAAYCFATAYHETAFTMQPVKEFGGPRYYTRMYDVTGDRPRLARANGNTTPGDGVKYCGRGYVQLTWKSNYARAGASLGYDLVGSPDLAMRPDIAALVMRDGMKGAWFTSIGLSDVLPGQGPATLAQFKEARRIINGRDRATVIAGYAMQFQAELNSAGWA